VRALVTGAAGFIGSTLVDRLLAEGHEVVAVDDLSVGNLDNLTDARALNRSRPHCFVFHRFDITDDGFVDLAIAAVPEVVFHLAAQADVRVSVARPVFDATVNLVGTVNVLEAAWRAGVRRVCFASSGGSIYGSPARLPVRERAGIDPHSPYAAGKAAADLYLSAFHRLHGIEYVSLALANVYGPRQDPTGEAGVVAIFLSALLAGRQTTIYGDGSQRRDFVYVDDVVDAFVRAAGTRGGGRRLNVGTGVGTTVRELHTMSAATVGAPDAPTFAPPRLGELSAIALDASAARVTLGWEPFTSLPAGLRLTADWLRRFA
jgi:UDP-glucose 4-epimerase